MQNAVNVGEVRKLFQNVDFIGVSAYAGLPRYPTLSDLETSLRKVDQELGLFGMSLKGLGKEIIYSEYGESSSRCSGSKNITIECSVGVLLPMRIVLRGG